jgi:hypothetical protein
MRIVALVLFVGVGCGCLGVYLGRGSRAALREEREAALAARPDEAPRPALANTCVAALSPDVLRAELARALDAAGVSAAPGAKTAAATAATDDPPAPPSPEQLAALDKARSGVEHAVAAENLTRTEAQDLRDLLQRIDDASRYQLTTRLIVALNQNKLRLEGELPF